MKERIVRGTVTASLGQRMLRALQVLFTGGETRDDLEHLEPYGFTSEPFTDGKTDAITLFFGEERSHGVVIAVADRRYRLKGMAEGEVALYDDKGRKVYLKRGGIEIDGASSPINVKTSAAVNVTAGSTVITAPQNTVKGPLTVTGLITGQGGLTVSGGSGANVTGSLTTTGDVKAGNISLQGHKHTCPDGDTGAAHT